MITMYDAIVKENVGPAEGRMGEHRNSICNLQSAVMSTNLLRIGIAFYAAFLTSFLSAPRIFAQTEIMVTGSGFPSGAHLAAVQELKPSGSNAHIGNPSSSIIELSAGTTPNPNLPIVSTNAGSASSVVYTCDATVNAVAGVCNFLNTTIAGLYSSAFTNAKISVYIKFGNTGLGSSTTVLNLASYAAYRTALIAAQTDSNDAIAINNGVSSTNPFGSDGVAMTNANARVLGFTPTFGLQSDGVTFCSLVNAGCYDSIITVSSSILASGGLYFRSGSIASNQVDFYSVVEHETDEGLGTSSCGFSGCSFNSSLYVEPPDLFRYHSNGARSLVAGTNNSCLSSDTTNACFSLDGASMLQHYNNLNNGEDAGDWAPNCTTPLVQNSEACSGVANLNISPNAEILVLDVIGYTLASPNPDLTIVKIHSGNFTRGQNGATYSLTVTNSGSTSTSGVVLVTDTIPTGLTLLSMAGTGWTCTTLPTCSRSDVLAAHGSYPAITVTVNVAVNAAASVTNAATVSGGGETNTANDTASDFTSVNIPPDLTITKSHVGNFTQGQNGVTYTITVTNSGTGSTTAQVTVTDILPSGLTLVSFSGAGWSCASQGCSRSDALPGMTSYPPITVNVNVSLNASTLTNTAIVSGGGEINTGNDSASDPTTVSAPQSALRYISVTPCRVADTRYNTMPSGFGAPFISGGVPGIRSFPIPNGSCGIPFTVQAYALNVTVVPHTTLDYLTVWPSGQAQPFVSTLNSLDGRIKANAAIVPAGTGSAISVFATQDTDLILDISGYFVADTGALAFFPLPPCRLVDTRPGAQSTISSGALSGGVSRTLAIRSSSCNVPVAQAYSLNLTVVPPGPMNFLSVYPTGVSQPLVSTLNDPTGTVTANAAIVAAGTAGNIDVYASNPTDLVVDINGYYAPSGSGGLSLYPLPPCRVLDTRNPGGAPPFSGTLNVNVISGGCGATSAAQAYVLNATVVPPGALAYLTLWPHGGAFPLVSTLNALDGQVTSNLAVVSTNDTEISAFSPANTYLILDISGYFAP